jgi:hypothetical protein
VLTQRLRVMLATGEARSLAPLDGTVTLVSSQSVHMPGPDGHGAERTHGVLRFERAGVATEVAFDEGKPFRTWDLAMAVFGGRGTLELSVFPEGVPVSP